MPAYFIIAIPENGVANFMLRNYSYQEAAKCKTLQVYMDGKVKPLW